MFGTYDENPLANQAILKLFDQYRDPKYETARQDLLTYIHEAEEALIYDAMSLEEQSSIATSHYFPDESGNSAYFYNGIPEKEKWKLFVDLIKQRKPSERGWVWL